VAVIACSLLWMVAELASVQLVQTVMLLLLVMSIVWALLGNRLAAKLFLPVMFIGLAIPVWGLTLPILQLITAESAYWLTRAAAIPAHMQDFIVTLPYGQLSIERACSGLNYLMAGVTLGVFYGYLSYGHWRHRLLVVLTVAGAAILANILRVFIIIWLAWQTNMQHPYVEDHLSLGWYLFGGLILLLLVVDHFVSARTGPQQTASQSVDDRVSGNCGYNRLQRLVVYMTTAALITLGPATARYVMAEAYADRGRVPDLPAGTGGWQGPTASNDSWMPVYNGAAEQKGLYKQDDAAVYLYTGFYPRQTQGAELINELNAITDGKDWRMTRSAEYMPEQVDVPVMEAELVTLTGRKRLVWYRYYVAGRYTNVAYRAKLLQVAGLLSGRPASAVIAVATNVDNDLQATRMRLADFMRTMEQPLAWTLGGEGSGG
jgi:EpsI family protein